MQPLFLESHASDLAVLGTGFLVLTGATVAFAVRAIQLIEEEGRADHKSIWRLTALRALAAICSLTGGLIVYATLAMMLHEIPGPLQNLGLPRLLPNDSRILVAAYVGSFLIFAMAYFGIAIAVGNDGKHVWRSFPALRWLSDRNTAISSAIRQWPPVVAVVAFVRKYDRPLW